MTAAQPVLPLNVALPVNDLLPLVSITIPTLSSILAVLILAVFLDARFFTLKVS